MFILKVKNLQKLPVTKVTLASRQQTLMIPGPSETVLGSAWWNWSVSRTYFTAKQSLVSKSNKSTFDM
jgi:hypothetical protein